MTVSCSWHVANLERHTADGVVYVVHWTCTASDGSNTAGCYGSVGLEPPAPSGLIPFNQLTEQIVIGWTHDKLGAEAVTAIEANLANQLAEIGNPTTASGVPWTDNATANEGTDA